MYDISEKGEEEGAVRCIERGKPTMVCINDNVVDDDDFEYIVDRVNAAFEKRFPDKCEFER